MEAHGEIEQKARKPKRITFYVNGIEIDIVGGVFAAERLLGEIVGVDPGSHYLEFEGKRFCDDDLIYVCDGMRFFTVHRGPCC